MFHILRDMQMFDCPQNCASPGEYNIIDFAK